VIAGKPERYTKWTWGGFSASFFENVRSWVRHHRGRNLNESFVRRPPEPARSGFSLKAPVLAVASILSVPPSMFFLFGPVKRFRRRWRGRCSKCNYDLQQLPEPRCPECAAVFDSTAVDRSELWLAQKRWFLIGAGYGVLMPWFALALEGHFTGASWVGEGSLLRAVLFPSANIYPLGFFALLLLNLVVCTIAFPALSFLLRVLRT